MLVMLATLLVLLIVSELTFRLLGSNLGVDSDQLARVRRYVQEGSKHYEPRPHTSYGLRRRGRVNSLGFSGDEWDYEKTPGVPRILCLGASTTQGGSAAGLAGSYPFLLEAGLEAHTGWDFEVLNAGVSGWTTSETLVTWFLLLRDFEPDLIIIHHAVNDVEARTTPGFRPDYLHWRTEWDPPQYSALHVSLVGWSSLYAWLTMGKVEVDLMGVTTTRGRGVRGQVDLTVDTARSFGRNIAVIGEDANRIGASVMLMTMPFYAPKGSPVRKVGVAQHNEIMRELCVEKGWMLADPALLIGDKQTRTLDTVFLDGVHVGVEGNLVKARMAADVLEKAWLPTLDAAAENPEFGSNR